MKQIEISQKIFVDPDSVQIRLKSNGLAKIKMRVSGNKNSMGKVAEQIDIADMPQEIADSYKKLYAYMVKKIILDRDPDTSVDHEDFVKQIENAVKERTEPIEEEKI